MKYVKSYFAKECLRRKRTPQNSTECYNKLGFLMELEQIYDPNANNFCLKPYSKRRERIVRMYWAFKKMEVV